MNFQVLDWECKKKDRTGPDIRPYIFSFLDAPSVSFTIQYAIEKTSYFASLKCLYICILCIILKSCEHVFNEYWLYIWFDLQGFSLYLSVYL